jgi:hypothetical protein
MVDCPSHARNTRPVGAAHSSPSSQHSLGTAPLFSLSVAKMLPALHVAGCSARAHFHFFVSLGCPSLLLSARAHLIPSHSLQHSFTSTALTLPLAPRLTVTNPSSPAMFYRPPSRHRGSQQSRQRQDSAKHRHRAFASCHPFRPRQSTRLHRKRTLLPLRAAFSLNSHMHPLRKRPRQLLALLLLLKEMAQRQSLCKRGHLSNSRVEGAHHHRHPSG